MSERDWGQLARDGASSFGRFVGRAARGGHHHLEVFLGGPDRTRVILLLAAVLGLSGADAATVGASASELRSALHISNTDIGLLVAVTSLVAAVASLPFGVLADKAPRTRTLGITIFLWGVAMLWSATSSSFGHLLAARAFLGVVTAAAGPIVASLVGDLFDGDERGRIYGYILTGEMIGGGIGFAVTGDVAALSWRLAFVLLAVPAFLLAWFIFHLPEPRRAGQGVSRGGGNRGSGQRGTAQGVPAAAAVWTPPDDDLRGGAGRGRAVPPDAGNGPPGEGPPAGPSLPYPGTDPPAPQETDAQRLARERGLRPTPRAGAADPERMGLVDAVRYIFEVKTNVILIVAGACSYFFLAGIQTFGVEFVKAQYGLSTLFASPLMLVIGLGAVGGVLTGGGLGDSLLRRRYLNGRVLVSALSAALAVVLFFPAVMTRSLLTAVPYLALAGFFLSVQQAPMNAARLDIMPAPLWGRAEGIRSAIRTAAQALAPLAFGFFSDALGGRTAAQTRAGLQWTFLIMLLPLAVGGYLLFTAMRTYPQDIANAAGAGGPVGWSP
jgi:MFS family permease